SGYLFPCFHMPDHGTTVRSGSDDVEAVRTERGVADRRVANRGTVVRQGPEELTRVRIPDPRCAVHTGRYHAASVSAELSNVTRPVMAHPRHGIALLQRG